MKKSILLLVVGILTVILGVMLFINGSVFGRPLMTLGMVIDAIAVVMILRQSIIAKKPH
jgi:hypothetical protein